MKRIFVLLIASLIICISLQSCSSKHKKRSKKEKEIEKMRLKREKETEKAYEDAVKRHRKMQTKDTRNRMKQSARTSKRIRENKREFFIKRWLRAKPKKGLQKDSKL